MPHVKEHLGENARIKYYTCPKTTWFKKWADLINRKGLLKCKPSTLVCSNHFQYGQPRNKSRHPSLYLKGYEIKPSVTRKAHVYSTSNNLDEYIIYDDSSRSDHVLGNSNMTTLTYSQGTCTTTTSTSENMSCDEHPSLEISSNPEWSKEEYENEIRLLKE